MQKIIHKVSESEVGSRLDMFLANLTGLSRSKIQDAIKAEQVQINNNIAKKTGIKLSFQDKIYAEILERELKIPAEALDLDILAETKDYIVINKDAGISVHPSQGANKSGTLLNAVLAHTKLSAGSSAERPGVVHRLDKDTSGVLIMAKNNKMHETLSKAFHDREVSKTYLALVIGKMKSHSGSIEASIRRSAKDRTKMTINSQGKKAISHFEVLEEFQGATLLQIKIETGRTHQIRLHMAGIGHPILGDQVYGDASVNADFKSKYGLKRQFLHAHELGILKKTFKAELKNDLEEVISKLRSL